MSGPESPSWTPWGVTECPPGYVDDNWILFVNWYPCTLYQPFKEAIQYVWIGLYFLAIAELFVSRFYLKVDKTPLVILVAYLGSLLTIFGSVLYHGSVRHATVTEMPDVVFVLLSLFFCLLMPVWLLFSMIGYFVDLAHRSLQVLMTENLGWARVRKVVYVLRVISFVLLAEFSITGFVLGVIMPIATGPGNPDLQNYYMTCMYALFSSTVFILGILFFYMITITHRAVKNQVRFLVLGIDDASNPNITVSFTAARKHPVAGTFADVMVRLEFVMVTVVGLAWGEAVLFIIAAIIGERWFLNIIAVGSFISAIPFVMIALFRPSLLPRFVGGRLGLVSLSTSSHQNPALNAAAVSNSNPGNNTGGSKTAAAGKRSNNTMSTTGVDASENDIKLSLVSTADNSYRPETSAVVIASLSDLSDSNAALHSSSYNEAAAVMATSFTGEFVPSVISSPEVEAP